MKLWWQSSPLAPGPLRVRLPSSPSTQASVVSTASTRPLYGRGAGSIPAGGSLCRADVAQPAEHRVARPEGPVRSGSSACTSPWCSGSTASSNLARPGSNPGGLARSRGSTGFGERRDLRGPAPPASGARLGAAGHPSPQREERRMHLRYRSGCGAEPQDVASGKGDPARDASQGAPRSGTARAVASPEPAA